MALLPAERWKFSAGEQALIQMADALSGAPANVSDELFRELRRHFAENLEIL